MSENIKMAIVTGKEPIFGMTAHLKVIGTSVNGRIMNAQGIGAISLGRKTRIGQVMCMKGIF